MNPNSQKILELIISLAVFGLLVTLVFGVALFFWRRRKKQTLGIEDRLGISDADPKHSRILRLWTEGREVTTLVPLQKWSGGLWKKLDDLRQHAGWKSPLGSILMNVAGVTGMVVAAVAFVIQNVFLALLVGAAVPMISWAYMQWRINNREALFERQLVDAMEMAARSLKAGHPLLGAFRLISEDLDEPIKGVFADICKQQQLGIDLGAALQIAGEQSTSMDMKLFATSVNIQLQSGGNLADMMNRLSAVVRERIRLVRRVRVLTAQTAFSKNVLLAMPFFMFILLNVLRREYMQTMYSTENGKIALGIAGSGLLLGWWMMNRLAKLKY